MPNETFVTAAELHENAAKSYRAAADAFDRGDVEAYNHCSALALDYSKRAYDASKPMETFIAAAELHESAAKSYRSAADAFEKGDLNTYNQSSASAVDFSKRAHDASKHAYEKTEKHHWMFI